MNRPLPPPRPERSAQMRHRAGSMIADAVRYMSAPRWPRLRPRRRSRTPAATRRGARPRPAGGSRLARATHPANERLVAQHRYRRDGHVGDAVGLTARHGRRDECRHGACDHGHGHEGMTTQHGVIRAAQAIGACKATMEVARTAIGRMLLQLVPRSDREVNRPPRSFTPSAPH